MQRNGDLLTAVKKEAGFGGFFGATPTISVEIPNQIKYEYLEMKDFIDNIDEKVSFAKNVNQEKLKNKVLVDLNRLNREERMVQKLEEKLAKQGIEVNESSMIKMDLDNLKSLQLFSDSLKNTSDNISQKIEACQQRITQLKDKIYDQRNQLRSLNSTIMEKHAKKEQLVKMIKKIRRQNPQLFTSINQNHLSGSIPFQSDFSTEDHYLTSVPEQMMNGFNFNNNSISSQQNPSIQLPQLQNNNMNNSYSQNNLKYKKLIQSSNSVSNIKHYNINIANSEEEGQKLNILQKSSSTQALPPLKYDPIQKLHKDIKKVRDINEEIKNYFMKKSNGFLEMKRLINECFNSQKKRIMKSHKISNQAGLADSMLFEINNNDIFAKSNASALQRQNNILSQTRLQDRELRNVLYETIKHIKAVKVVQEENQNNQEIISQYQVTYQQFREFTPDQLLILMSIKPEVLQQFLTVFDLKEKAMNLMVLKAKLIFKNKFNNNLDKQQLEQSQNQINQQQI
ncbi:hypothetical protein ABPG74_005655 [Tetrahymena malaccensis]